MRRPLPCCAAQYFAEKHETSKQTFLPKFGVLRDEEVSPKTPWRVSELGPAGARSRLPCACIVSLELMLSPQDVQAARTASGTVAAEEKLAVRSPGIKVKRASCKNSFVDVSK